MNDERGIRLSEELERCLNVQDYSPRPRIEGVRLVDLSRFNDEAGSMIELARLSDGGIIGLESFRPARINCATCAPGTVKAFHVHRRQTDVWYVPPEDRVLLVLLDGRDGSATEKVTMRILLGDGCARLVVIPPGVVHGCRNLGSSPARIIYFTDLPFSPDPAETDEGRLPWDLLGAGVWEASRD